NKSRSSVAPSCLPAMLKGGHGTPPASRSTPRYSSGFQSSESATSPILTVSAASFSSYPSTLMRLWRSVSAACLSSSTASTCRKPARSSPSDCPPAPAQISTTLSVSSHPDGGFLDSGSPVCSHPALPGPGAWPSASVQISVTRRWFSVTGVPFVVL